jgi:putative tryptophan/tyrosine transport system substrate-binding protein
MRRRQFISLLGSAAAWPLAARAQQRALPVIGWLNTGSPDETSPGRFAEFKRGLSEGGFLEGRDVVIEYHWAEGQYDRLAGRAADLVRRRVAVICTNPAPAAIAAKAATSTIPIVFTMGADPVALGLAGSLSRPGGNLTGESHLTVSLQAKRLEMLRELVPRAGILGVLLDGASPVTESERTEIEAAARSIGQAIYVVTANNDREIDDAFLNFAEHRVSGLVVGGGAPLGNQRQKIVALAARYGIPAVYPNNFFARVGGLMSYATDFNDTYHQVGVYVGRILSGAKPAELPIVQPTKFELVINLKTARTLGLTVPPTLLAIADDVIE